MKEMERQQEQDSKLSKILQRLTDKDDHVSQFYCKHQGILFIKTQNKFETWKIPIPQATEKDLILNYHERDGQMGALKVVKVLQEHVYMKDANRKEGTMIPITTSCKLEKVFVDICGPFSHIGGKHQYKYLIIVFDHYTRLSLIHI